MKKHYLLLLNKYPLLNFQNLCLKRGGVINNCSDVKGSVKLKSAPVALHTASPVLAKCFEGLEKVVSVIREMTVAELSLALLSVHGGGGGLAR